MCARGFWLSELISLALGAAAFGVVPKPSYLCALEQQQVCPCAAVLPVSIQSPSESWGHSGPGWF